MDGLLYHAKEAQADIVCFGHTHRPYVEEIDNILFINPGSLCYPRSKYPEPTYCILDTSTKEVAFYNAISGQVCDPFTTPTRPPFSFKKLFKK
jgi:putative phosphoesterase